MSPDDQPVEATVERGASNELGNAVVLALSVVVIAVVGRLVLPDAEVARVVFVLAVIGYVAVVRLRLRRDRVRSTVVVRLTASALAQTSADPALDGEVQLASAVTRPRRRHKGEAVAVLADHTGVELLVPQRVGEQVPQVAAVLTRIPEVGTPGHR